MMMRRLDLSYLMTIYRPVNSIFHNLREAARSRLKLKKEESNLEKGTIRTILLVTVMFSCTTM